MYFFLMEEKLFCSGTAIQVFKKYLFWSSFQAKFLYTAEDIKFIKTNLAPRFQTMKTVSLKKASPFST